MSQRNNPSAIAGIFKSLAGVEPHELSAVMLSMLYFLFLFGSYSVIKPVRDAMGTVYGIKHLNELFLGTFIGTLILAPLYAGMASRLSKTMNPIELLCNVSLSRRVFLHNLLLVQRIF